jgi:putative transposase
MDEECDRSPELSVGQYLHEPASDTVFLVLWTGRGSDESYIIDTEHAKPRRSDHRAPFVKFRTADLLARLLPEHEPEGERLVLLEHGPIPPAAQRYHEPFQYGRLPERLPAHQVSKRYAVHSDQVADAVNAALSSDGWRRISGILTFREFPNADGSQPEPSIYSASFRRLLDDSTRADTVKEFCAITGETRWTMYRAIRAYCQGGMTPEAVVEDYEKCGARGKDRVYVNRPGRKNSISPVAGIPRTEVVETQLLMAAERYLTFEYGQGKRRRKTKEQCLNWLLAKFYATSIEIDEEGFITELELEESDKPTVRQLDHILRTRYTYTERQIAKVGLKKWELQQRPLVGRLRNSNGPGERFHIDATRANVYLVNRLMRSKVAGRPFIFTVVDDYSCLITGVYVCFESPSWQGAMMALLNAATPKVPFCASMGIDITEDQWACHRFPGSYRYRPAVQQRGFVRGATQKVSRQLGGRSPLSS